MIKLATIRHIGGLPEGYILDPFTGREFPFKGTEPFQVPADVAERVTGESSLYEIVPQEN